MPFQFRKEAIEEDLNSNFPSQGQGNPPLYYSLSEVVVPTYSINQAAEGSSLPENLQKAWDFSTGHEEIINTTSNIITNTGFWKVNVVVGLQDSGGGVYDASVNISDGLTSKKIWAMTNTGSAAVGAVVVTDNEFVVFLRSGDVLTGTSSNPTLELNVTYRQIATVNGTLVNPLGYSAA